MKCLHASVEDLGEVRQVANTVNGHPCLLESTLSASSAVYINSEFI